MFKFTLSLQPNVTGDQLKEQIKQTIKAAREAQVEAIRDVQTERGVMVVPPVPPDQLQQIAQSVDAIAIEVERISEGQRFTTRMLTDRSNQTVMASHATSGQK